MVTDASFESRFPAWFSNDAHDCFVEKEKVDGAANGEFVLAVQGWEITGSNLLSPPIELTMDTYSAGLRVRSFGVVEGAVAKLAIYYEKGVQKLASFGELPMDGKGLWVDLQTVGVKFSSAKARGRLVDCISGPQQNARVEIDQIGLFAGNELQPVVDNSDLSLIEADTR